MGGTVRSLRGEYSKSLKVEVKIGKQCLLNTRLGGENQERKDKR